MGEFTSQSFTTSGFRYVIMYYCRRLSACVGIRAGGRAGGRTRADAKIDNGGEKNGIPSGAGDGGTKAVSYLWSDTHTHTPTRERTIPPSSARFLRIYGLQTAGVRWTSVRRLRLAPVKSSLADTGPRNVYDSRRETFSHVSRFRELVQKIYDNAFFPHRP